MRSRRLPAVETSDRSSVNAFLKKLRDMLIRLAKLIGIAVLFAGCSGAPLAGNGVPASAGSAATARPSTAVASTTGALPAKTTSLPIALRGAPPGSVTVGTDYTFQPTVLQGGPGIGFSIEGKPAWASFNEATGSLRGTPTTNDVGLTGAINIIARNGASTATIGPFRIEVVP
jgi:hypothetical protein